MKSFADWTDEIRSLMNPPAPMVDTCNLSEKIVIDPKFTGTGRSVAAKDRAWAEFVKYMEVPRPRLYDWQKDTLRRLGPDRFECTAEGGIKIHDATELAKRGMSVPEVPRIDRTKYLHGDWNGIEDRAATMTAKGESLHRQIEELHRRVLVDGAARAYFAFDEASGVSVEVTTG